MSLLSNPRLLLLDEPTAGMDVEARREFWTAIREDAARGRTVMFATHYLEEADAYADRIVLVRQGTIVADGTTAAVKSMASGRTVRATIPNADRHTLAALNGVTSVELRGDTVLITCTDSDAVARHLLTETAASDLEITLQLARSRIHGADGRRRGGGMSTAIPTTTAEPASEALPLPALGGFNLTALALEIRRMLRNRRTVMFIVVFPSLFFFMFRASGGGANAARIQSYVLISMAVYGAMVGTTAGGAAVAVERSLGWSRQLRLTPLRPAAYIAMKVLTAMVLGLCAVISAFAVGALSGVHMAPERLDPLRPRRVGLLARLCRVRPLHGLPAAERERDAVRGADAGHPGDGRRTVRAAAESSARDAHDRAVLAGVWRGRDLARAARWRALDGRRRERRRLDRHLRRRGHAPLPARYRAGVIRDRLVGSDTDQLRPAG